MNNAILRRSYNVILLSIFLLLLVSVQLSIPVTAETNHQSTTLTLKTNSWHSWTRNPNFNSYGLYWKARTWKWDILSYISSYCLLYSKAVDVLNGYTHYAGITQGWVWSSNSLSCTYQLTPLRIILSIHTNELYHSMLIKWVSLDLYFENFIVIFRCDVNLESIIIFIDSDLVVNMRMNLEYM